MTHAATCVALIRRLNGPLGLSLAPASALLSVLLLPFFRGTVPPPRLPLAPLARGGLALFAAVTTEGMARNEQAITALEQAQPRARLPGLLTPGLWWGIVLWAHGSVYLPGGSSPGRGVAAPLQGVFHRLLSFSVS